MTHYDDFALADIRGASGFWYLGTPFTRFHAGPAEAYLLAAQLSSVLSAHGVAHFCPIAQHCNPVTVAPGLDLLDVDFWMKITAPVRRQSCGLIIGALKGWKQSQGLQQEGLEFEREGKPVYALNRVALVRLIAALKK